MDKGLTGTSTTYRTSLKEEEEEEEKKAKGFFVVQECTQMQVVLQSPNLYVASQETPNTA